MEFVKTLVEKDSFKIVSKMNNSYIIHLLPEESNDIENCLVCWECLSYKEPNENDIDNYLKELNIYINKLNSLEEIDKSQKEIKELKLLL